MNNCMLESLPSSNLYNEISLLVWATFVFYDKIAEVSPTYRHKSVAEQLALVDRAKKFPFYHRFEHKELVASMINALDQTKSRFHRCNWFKCFHLNSFLCFVSPRLSPFGSRIRERGSACEQLWACLRATVFSVARAHSALDSRWESESEQHQRKDSYWNHN